MRLQDYMIVIDSKNTVVTNNHATGAGGNQFGIQVSTDSSDVISDNVADYIQVSSDTNSTIKGNTVDEGGLYNTDNNEVDVENNHEKYYEGALLLRCLRGAWLRALMQHAWRAAAGMSHNGAFLCLCCVVSSQPACSHTQLRYSSFAFRRPRDVQKQQGIIGLHVQRQICRRWCAPCVPDVALLPALADACACSPLRRVE